jgi:hypothetical protein
MVSNLGIEKDKEMSKLRPPVDLLGGFFNILQYIQTSTLLLLLDLKGQCHEIFCFCFFHESVSPKPLIIQLGPFRIFFKIRGDIHSSMTPVANGKNLQSEKFLWLLLDTCTVHRTFCYFELTEPSSIE